MTLARDLGQGGIPILTAFLSETLITYLTKPLLKSKDDSIYADDRMR